ncbi:uncharacterized protein A4U43_C08F23140 [Asparagus officinalis]|nr:uncharacterized protein A4U43_C08F23140 [Asparagus officinalis]
MGNKTFHSYYSISEIPLLHYSHKPIATPLLGIVILTEKYTLAFPKLNKNNNSNSCSATWTKPDSLLKYFEEIIFHKGRIHDVDWNGTLAAFDLDDSSDLPPLFSPKGPLKTRSPSTAYLVESRMERTCSWSLGLCYKWKKVENTEDVALFVGSNHSVALSTAKFPRLKPISVCFTKSYFSGMELGGDTGVYRLQHGTFEFLSAKHEWSPGV